MPRPDLSMSASEIEHLLDSTRHGVLTTVGRDGWPHSAGMWFVRDGSALLMWTYRKSQKAVNVRRDARVAFLVERGEPYRDLRGVLVRARAELVEERAAVARIGRLLLERYIDEGDGVYALARAIEHQAAKRLGLRLPLERLASWDHSRAR